MPPRTDAPLRIAMIGTPFFEIPPSGYGGIELISADLVDALVALGHEVTLFSGGSRTGTNATYFVSTVPELQAARLGQTMPDLLHAARAQRLLRSAADEFDIVHDHSAAGPLMAGTRTAPTVVTVHGETDGEMGDLYADLGDSIQLVAISQFQRDRRPNLNWAGTVHNALDPSQFVAEHRPDGPVLWLPPFPPLPALPLVLVGKCNEPAEEEYLESEIRPMLGPDVELVLNADRTATKELLTAARCLIMPIRWHEPFGMVMVEAMASGTPVVALRRGSVPEVVEHGVTGWICDEPEELPEWLKRCGELDSGACVERVREHFSADVMAAEYEKVYRKVLKGRRGSRDLEPAAPATVGR